MTNEPTPETDAKLSEARALLGLLADIRAAVGDPTGKLMQDELVERCRKLRADNELLRAANADTKRIAEQRNRMEAALKGIVEYGKLCNPGTDTDCARLIYLAKQALAK